MSLERLAQRTEELEPYDPDESVEALAERLNLPRDQILKLNANENLFLPASTLRRFMVEAASETDPRLYPGGEREALARELAQLNGVTKDQILIASGGDQIIGLVLSSLLRPGDTLAAVTPTFSMYPRTAKAMGLGYTSVPLDEHFLLNGDRVLEDTWGADLVVICSPNNPTSNQFPLEKVMKVVDGFDGPVLIDEAYAEFGGYSLIRETSDRGNLIVLRTFSKAYGLAGLRLGYAVSNTTLTRRLSKYMMPFPVPGFVLRVGVKALREQEVIRSAVEEVKVERSFLIKSLNEVPGVQAFPSETNFVLFSLDRPYKEVYSELKERGVLVRRIGSVPGRRDCLRVTVAPRRISGRFLEALREVLA